MIPSEPIAQDPTRSPSYPQRVHIRERGQWQSLLQTWETKISVARRSTAASKPGSDRLLAQMSGARDQIADAVRRLPMETGDLYEEDKHKVEEAVEALKRVFLKFEAI